MAKIKVAFLWFGIKGRYGIWQDGLYAAMKIIEQTCDVTYHEPTDEVDPNAIVLFWEALCTRVSKDKDMFEKVMKLPNKKALLFAGGPIKEEWFEGFDHIFWESKIDGEVFERMGISNSCAFGINEKVFYPEQREKKYDSCHFGTSASWKRQWLLGEAVKEKGLIVGRYQETDRRPFDDCKRFGCIVLPEMHPNDLRPLLNESWTCGQTCAKDGGGQRCTLEALACNVPVICMTDSPKNREYVEESGCGMVVEPNIQDIHKAVEECKKIDWGTKGRDYIMSKWTSQHYADALLQWINQ